MNVPRLSLRCSLFPYTWHSVGVHLVRVFDGYCCRKPWNIAVLLRPRPLFSGSVASCTRWQLPYSMFSNFLSMFSCFCAYKLSWLYPLAETVDLHVPKYRKHRWHARSMSEAVFYFAFSAQTCLHCMKTRFFQLFTIEIFWYLFQTSFFARIPHELYLNPFNCNSELSIPIGKLYGNGELVVKWASPLWRLLVNHDRRRIRSCCHPVNSLSSVSSSSVFCGDSTLYLYMSFVFYVDNTIST